MSDPVMTQVAELTRKVSAQCAGYPVPVVTAALGDVLAMCLAQDIDPGEETDAAVDDVLACFGKMVRNLMPINRAMLAEALAAAEEHP